MLSLLVLLVAFQLPDYHRQAEDLRRLEELKDNTYEKAKQRDKEYRKAKLYEDHQEFVQKFNQYLLKYHSGALATKEIQECVRAWEKLRRNPDSGFDNAKR